MRRVTFEPDRTMRIFFGREFQSEWIWNIDCRVDEHNLYRHFTFAIIRPVNFSKTFVGHANSMNKMKNEFKL